MRRAPILVTAFLLFHARPTSAEANGIKSLARVHDPVIISTGALAVADHRTANWRLYRLEGDQAVPVPFQFDPVDGKGAVEVDRPAEFQFDQNDELVFMAKDSGDRAAQPRWPDGYDDVEEIEITDPINQQHGWVYLLHFNANAPPRIEQQYVRYDDATNRALSSFYEVAYAPARNFFTELKVGSAAGGNGSNLLRQTHMLGIPTLHLLFTDITLRFTEQNSLTEIEGIRSGPVRVVRRVRLAVDLGKLLPDLPNGIAYTFHYLSSYTTPTQISVPWLALKTLRSFCFEDLTEFTPAVMPQRYWDGANPGGLTWADGDTPRVESTVDHDWWVHSGSAGTMLHAFVIPPEWRQWGIRRGTVFRNNTVPAEGQACDRDPSYAAGYSLLDMTNLRDARSYDLLQASVVLPHPYRPGDEEAPMAMLRAPLKTEVRPRIQ